MHASDVHADTTCQYHAPLAAVLLAAWPAGQQASGPVGRVCATGAVSVHSSVPRPSLRSPLRVCDFSLPHFGSWVLLGCCQVPESGPGSTLGLFSRQKTRVSVLQLWTVCVHRPSCFQCLAQQGVATAGVFCGCIRGWPHSLSCLAQVVWVAAGVV